jgi:hypothetical protein
MLEVDRLIYDLSQEFLSLCRDVAHLLPDSSSLSPLLAPPDLAQQHQQAASHHHRSFVRPYLPRTPASLSPHDSTTTATPSLSSSLAASPYLPSVQEEEPRRDLLVAAALYSSLLYPV